MPLFNDSLPLHTEHILGKRCEILQNYAPNNQFFLETLQIEAPKNKSRRLKKLHAACTTDFISQIFSPFQSGNEINSELIAFDFDEQNALWLHTFYPAAQSTLSMRLSALPIYSTALILRLERIFTIGIHTKSPVDLCFDFLETAVHLLENSPNAPSDLAFDATTASISFSPIQGLIDILNLDCEYDPGHTKVWIDKHLLHIQYEVDTLILPPSKPQLPQTIEVTRFFDTNPTESLDENLSDIQAFDFEDPSLEVQDISKSEELSMFKLIREFGKSPNDKRQNWLMSEDSDVIPTAALTTNTPPPFNVKNIDLDCPTLMAIHMAIHSGEGISPEAAKLVLEEAQQHLPPVLRPALLYMLHFWAPSLDEEIKLEALNDSAAPSPSPLIISILKDIYRTQNSDTMLIALLQRQINACTFNIHQTIALELESIGILASKLEMHTVALKRLEALKSTVLQHGNPQERIRFALCYHHSQYTGMAIQYLRLWMNQAEDPQTTALYGYQLANVMFEHNEPMQSIITVCNQILDAIPQHIETLELLARCLESTNRFRDASDAWMQCFERFVRLWETAQLQYQMMPSSDNELWLHTCQSRAIHAAEMIEKSMDDPQDASIRILVLNDHLRLEPGSVRVVARLLKDLEATHAFHEMAHTCLSFLKHNKGTISPKDEIAIRLTLHNIYDRELDRPYDAIEQLNKARALSAFDPRVIYTEIERCRKSGQKKEQISLRLALIDALPPAEAVEQTLELVNIYESLDTPPEQIVDILRKTNARSPNNPQILLELRLYLRKIGQNFELATVLEKLARVTQDLQMRKNILLEASEVNEKLGNIQIAQSQYHEAQLCSPIDPDNNDGFMPQSIHGDFMTDGPQYQASSPLSSMMLTSRSLSIVEDISGLLSDPSISNVDQILDDTTTPPGTPSSQNTPISNILQNTPPNAQSEPSPNEASHSGFDNMLADDAPLEDQIVEARIRGNTQALLDRLLLSIQSIPEAEQPPRVLQEIACIYLYDRHDPQTARQFLERASALNHDIAFGEQTLNALEIIYQSMKMYKELAEVYEKKCEILTIADERRKYEMRLAQIRYEHLGQTDLAIETLNNLLQRMPKNETALQLLAQIYIDTQNPTKAIETLKIITPLLKPDSKPMAQHLLRLISLHIQNDNINEAKKLMHALLDHNNYVDKLAVIELYKRTCREHDEWNELLDILLDELAFYLRIPKQELNLFELIRTNQMNTLSAGVHTLREYADVLYLKLHRIDEATEIYQFLTKLLPDDDYPKNILFEIAEQHPENESVISRIVELSAPHKMASIASTSGTALLSDNKDTSAIYEEIEAAFKYIQTGSSDSASQKLTQIESQTDAMKRKKYYAPIIFALRQHLYAKIESGASNQTMDEGETIPPADNDS